MDTIKANKEKYLEFKIEYQTQKDWNTIETELDDFIEFANWYKGSYGCESLHEVMFNYYLIWVNSGKSIKAERNPQYQY